MSLAIDVERVTRVLLADGWHDVLPLVGRPTVSSFTLDAYEFFSEDDDREPLLAAGTVDGGMSTGFSFYEGVYHQICGPLTAILAVDIGQDPPLP
jgi:hypothetical protein